MEYIYQNGIIKTKNEIFVFLINIYYISLQKRILNKYENTDFICITLIG